MAYMPRVFSLIRISVFLHDRVLMLLVVWRRSVVITECYFDV